MGKEKEKDQGKKSRTLFKVKKKVSSSTDIGIRTDLGIRIFIQSLVKFISLQISLHVRKAYGASTAGAKIIY